MRHPDDFCIGFDPTEDWQEKKRKALQSGNVPVNKLMKDDNIYYMQYPDEDVLWLMIEYDLSRGEAEFILNWNKY